MAQQLFGKNKYGDFTNLNAIYTIITGSDDVVVLEGEVVDGPTPGPFVTLSSVNGKRTYQFIQTGPKSYAVNVIDA
ncbi:MAG TPA: hypothetical protein VG326_21470 [Tepidisphaeraceae bacterium]|jgi:hypothetical protein|nr:hypothetical protein [Tepidisphaeraceae bacterium]